MVPEEVEFIVPETYTDEELAALAGDIETIICVRLAEEVVRAAIVDEDAVWKALNEGWIAGAAIDVWWTPHWWDATWLGEGQEATPSKYPFHELENVVVTPHVAGSTDTSGPRSLEIIAENIHRISTGREPINQVDKRLQY